jgi:ABC-type nitrate/sulfonate/bicarbonate transport system substrate-binding protein
MAKDAAMKAKVGQRGWRTQQTRRDFLTTSTTGALALLLAGLPRGWVGGAYAGDGPETPKVRIGIIALTDCSSIVMAHELGLFKKYGIESTISKEASWAVIRDRLTLGENQATHILLGMPYASTMGLLGSPVKPMIIPFYLNRNGQAITLTKGLLVKGVKTPQALKPLAVARPQYINAQKEVILGRLLGQYDYGDGRPVEQDPYYMIFFDRHTNFPWKSNGIWWLSQFRRWGMAKEEVDYTGLVNRVHRPDIFREVAKEMGIEAPDEDMKKETLFDGIEFDPAQPEQYVRMFAVHNLS